VEAGDTLWTIAADLAGPSVDVRSVVADIKRDNGLQTSALKVGQVLVIQAP
jgi:hypothetical protein